MTTPINIDVATPPEINVAIELLRNAGLDIHDWLAEWRKALDEVAWQAAEIEQLRTELASANERALEPAERAAAAIQLADAFRNWAQREEAEALVPSLNLRAAAALWETVR